MKMWARVKYCRPETCIRHLHFTFSTLTPDPNRTLNWPQPDPKLCQRVDLGFNEYLYQSKGIESLPQINIFESLYLGNLWMFTFDISNLNYLILLMYSLKYLRSTTFGCKDIGIRKSEIVGKTQFLSNARSSTIGPSLGKRTFYRKKVFWEFSVCF